MIAAASALPLQPFPPGDAPHRVIACVLRVRLVASAAPQTAKRTIPCKSAANATMCYTTHARLAYYTAAPSWRIWKQATNETFAVLSGPTAERRDPQDNEHPELPEVIEKTLASDYQRKAASNEDNAALPSTLFADFELCPITPLHNDAMKSVCIENAKNITVDKSGYVPR